MNRRGSALLTVLTVVILVSVITFATSTFISTSLVRYTTQNRNMQGEYLAQAGIHRAIYNINVGSPAPVWPLNFSVGSNTIAVDLVASCGTIYQLASKGTSVATVYPTQIARTVFAEYNSGTNKITKYLQGDGTGVLPPVCCDSVAWPFSEGSGDTTGTAPFLGTRLPLLNKPSWVVDWLGPFNSAIRFNQSGVPNYVLVPDSTGSALDLTSSGTVMAWINPAAIPNQAMQTIVHKGGSTTASNAYALFLRRQSNNQARVRFWIYNAAGTQYLASGGTNMGLNTWYHIAGVWDSTGLRVYRNGWPDGTTTTANRVARTNNNSLYIGASGVLSAAQKFNGTIDEVNVYGCRKTDDEIKAYYNSTCAGSGATPCPRP